MKHFIGLNLVCWLGLLAACAPVAISTPEPTVTRQSARADCPARPDDTAGYLAAICRYVIDHQINVDPAKPATYAIKRTEERTQDNRAVVWVFLNCCGLGDIAVIDPVTNEVIDFRVGAY